MGTIDVLAPVNRLNIAITNSITADTLCTISEAGFCVPLERVINSTSRPMKTNVRPSAIHSIVMILLLSSDIDPKPLTIDLDGLMCAIPQSVIIIEPM